MPDDFKKTPLQVLKEQNDAIIAEHEAAMAELPEGERAHYFRVDHKEGNPPSMDPDTLKVVTLLSQRVDCIRNAADRKKFFLAHPELEVRYSFANFIE